MSDIVEFLEARIAEDEAVARAATEGPWEWEPESDGWGDCGPNLVTVAKLPPYPDGSQSPVESVIGSWGHDANGISVSPADSAHIVRHDPTRILAECAAKRLIIKLAQRATEDEKAFDDYEWQGTVERSEPWTGDAILYALAAVYKDHPDYQQEWAL